MINCILWGTGHIFKQNINCIKYHELCGEIKVIGITSGGDIFDKVFGYDFIPKDQIGSIDYDLIIVMTDRKIYPEIETEAVNMGISQDRIISYEILRKPKCDLKKYRALKRNTPTIFSSNCWAGLTYHSLYLKLSSPIINMYIDEEDYIKLLKRPKHYMEQPLQLKEHMWDDVTKLEYPVCLCDDILLHFNHYKNFELAARDWNRRKQRIDWDNLFVMMYTEDREIAEEFSKLGYEKKICFVPFPTAQESLCSLDFCNRGNLAGKPFWSIVNAMATGEVMYYSDIDLLYDGKVVDVNL